MHALRRVVIDRRSESADQGHFFPLGTGETGVELFERCAFGVRPAADVAEEDADVPGTIARDYGTTAPSVVAAGIGDGQPIAVREIVKQGPDIVLFDRGCVSDVGVGPVCRRMLGAAIGPAAHVIQRIAGGQLVPPKSGVLVGTSAQGERAGEADQEWDAESHEQEDQEQGYRKVVDGPVLGSTPYDDQSTQCEEEYERCEHRATSFRRAIAMRFLHGTRVGDGPCDSTR